MSWGWECFLGENASLVPWRIPSLGIIPKLVETTEFITVIVSMITIAIVSILQVKNPKSSYNDTRSMPHFQTHCAHPHDCCLQFSLHIANESPKRGAQPSPSSSTGATPPWGMEPAPLHATPTVSLSGKFRNVPSLKKNTSAVILPCMSPHYIKNCWQLRHKAAIHQKLPNWLSVFLKPSTQNHPEHPASLNLCSNKPMSPSQSIASKYGSQFLCSVSWLFRAAMDKTSLKPPLPKNK